ncbi:TPR-like protein [Trametes coccinea BRFM310]|uniref:TPR-like protein n=1 Tax=Trametes coccinea (strain BRFM310) TaxID=1353009 RepID=A0A1Y2J0C1_TRAC3|nr:TPR-like protein [Trametes coccinea BRFM310]
MSLPLLVNGAECGPSNPLQGLSKRFDQDRGIQQDQFGAGRAGSSKETFRSQYAPAPGVDQDAARFFSAGPSPAPALSAAPSSFDLSALHRNLPGAQFHSAPPTAAHMQSPMQSPPLQSVGPAAWAADFLQQQPGQQSASHLLAGKGVERQATPLSREHNMSPLTQSAPGAFVPAMTWSPMHNTQFAPMTGVQQQGIPQMQASQIDAAKWDQEFRSQELSLNSAASVPSAPVNAEATETASRARAAHEADELARTAGLLLDTVQGETNPKFKNSAFMGLMRQLRDGELIVEGNDFVERELASGAQTTGDAKGKGRAADAPTMGGGLRMQLPTLQRPVAGPSEADTQHYAESSEDAVKADEDPNDAYFRQENEDYIAMQSAMQDSHQMLASPRWNPQTSEWDNLQDSWDAFEATSTGIRPLTAYQFQSNNPYLHGETSRTRHHAAHGGIPETLYESVLELEAAVQRDPTNVARWYELGVKQQENEREQKAVQALRRALELDPTHLPSWLALAVSHTNEGDRASAYNAIREWVTRNDRYAAAVAQFREAHPEPVNATQGEKLTNLMHCLMSIVRENAGGEIDADIQIALAVLLNTNEEYAKARDCFTTALAVRPDDWLLYNRVGATLANSGRPDEALQYYYTALELNPAYIRARFNLGISCINLRRYDEAAQHILDALVLQDGDSVHDPEANDKRGVTSSALWDSLKTCCLHMQRLDLATLCDRRDLEAFRLNFSMQ